MNRTSISLIAAAAFASSLLAVPASAQNYPPPGNVNPGSLNSGAEESGAENQPRSFEPSYGGARSYYDNGYGAFATPYGSTGNAPAHESGDGLCAFEPADGARRADLRRRRVKLSEQDDNRPILRLILRRAPAEAGAFSCSRSGTGFGKIMRNTSQCLRALTR